MTNADRAVSFPDALISRSQCLAGAIGRGTPSITELHDLLTEVPAEASPAARLIVKQVLMRVFGRFVAALDARRDAASIQAFVAWSAADLSSEHWRDDLLDLFGVWSAAQTSRDGATPPASGIADLRIRRVIEALDRRYADPQLALEDIAVVANLSVCRVARLLKRKTGRGFVAHLHQRRIAAACGLLTGTTLSMKEVADRVGYKSASEFGRHFRRASGMTPSEYRRACVAHGRRLADKIPPRMARTHE
jgi:AraC-like DNA-binding protein